MWNADSSPSVEGDAVYVSEPVTYGPPQETVTDPPTRPAGDQGG